MDVGKGTVEPCSGRRLVLRRPSKSGNDDGVADRGVDDKRLRPTDGCAAEWMTLTGKMTGVQLSRHQQTVVPSGEWSHKLFIDSTKPSRCTYEKLNCNRTENEGRNGSKLSYHGRWKEERHQPCDVVVTSRNRVTAFGRSIASW